MSALALYRLATRLGGPLFELALQRRVRRAREDPARLAERRGRPSAPRPAGPLVWLHAASVGEALAVLPLLEALLAARPALQALLTTGTVTSARLMAERLPPRARHQFVPLDRPAAWRAFLDHWRPQLALLVESELWPNLILESRRRGVPLALINARMSARSQRRWQRAAGGRGGAARGLRALPRAERGRPRPASPRSAPAQVRALGNLKSPRRRRCRRPRAALAELVTAIGARPVWLAASTHPGEDRAAARRPSRAGRARLPTLLTIIVPRHPERGAALAAWLQGQGIGVARRSRGALPEPAGAALPRRHAGRARPVLPPRAGRLRRQVAGARAAARTRSRRRGSAVRCCSARIWTNFAELAASLLRAGAARQVADAARARRGASPSCSRIRRPARAMAERGRAAARSARRARSTRPWPRWRRCSSGPSAPADAGA